MALPGKWADLNSKSSLQNGRGNIRMPSVHGKISGGRTHGVFNFPIEIRKIIYTTNLIENLNGKV